MHRAILIASLAALLAFAQPPAFEVASIKPAAQVGGLIVPTLESNPGRVTMRNYTLKALLMYAYQVTRYQVDGPPWAERDRFDILATKAPGGTPDQARQMMQNLLAQRFHVALHRVNRDLPAYVLLPGKGPSKLHPVEEGRETGDCHTSGTMAQLADMLAQIVQSPVTDQTGISGRFYFIVAWTPLAAASTAGTPGDQPPPPPAAPPPPASPMCRGWQGAWPPLADSVFDAVRDQMGLRLERRGTATVNVLVLDRAGKPTAN